MCLCPAWTPRPYYSAQLAAGVGNVVIVEGIPDSWVDFDTTAVYVISARPFGASL